MIPQDITLEQLTRLLYALAPMGSEYVNNPVRCIERITADMEQTFKIALHHATRRAKAEKAVGLLLEACKTALIEITQGPPYHEPAIELIKAAIAKAEASE